MMNMIYDVLPFRKYVDFSTEMVKRHVTSGKVYVQRKYKKYAYDEFDAYMIFYKNTKHNQRNYIIVGSQSNFVIINTIIFGQFRTNYPLHGKKRTNESLIENFLFFMMMSIPL